MPNERVAHRTAGPLRSVAMKVLAAVPGDPPAGEPARMTIVASDDLAYGLGRMYEALRELAPGSVEQAKSPRNALSEALKCPLLGYLMIGRFGCNPAHVTPCSSSHRSR